LLIESLQQFHHYYGDDFKWNAPPGPASSWHLKNRERAFHRLIKLWLSNENGERPSNALSGNALNGSEARYLFHEYFHGEPAPASAPRTKTGWTVHRETDSAAGRVRSN